MTDSVHRHLFSVCPRLNTDYKDYGGQVERWSDPAKNYPDCSCGCKFAYMLDSDWLVCGNPNSPRHGMLTWEHQAGEGCFVPIDNREEQAAEALQEDFFHQVEQSLK